MISKFRIPTIHEGHIEQIEAAIGDVPHPGQIVLQDSAQQMLIVAGIDESGDVQGITMACPVDELSVRLMANALNPTNVPAIFVNYKPRPAGGTK